VPIAVAVLLTLEGTVLVGYHDRIDPPGVNTVCTGHIEDVHIGDRYTRIECKDMLAKDLPRYEAMVQRCIHVPMPDYRHAAILSFTYNVGGGKPATHNRPAKGGLCGSSVARKLNAGDVKGGCNALLLYDRANGKIIPGLERRRKAERIMCLSDANNPNATIEAGPPVPPELHIDILRPDNPQPIISVVPDKEKVIVVPEPAPQPQPSAGQRVKDWLMER
jgi:lysozyme